MWKRLIFGLAIENRKSKWPMQQGKQNLRRTQKCKRRARARTQIVPTDRRLELKPGRISITKANENKSKCMDDCRGQMRWRREREWKMALSHTGKSWMIWVGFILMNSCVIFALIFVAVAARRWFFFLALPILYSSIVYWLCVVSLFISLSFLGLIRAIFALVWAIFLLWRLVFWFFVVGLVEMVALVLIENTFRKLKCRARYDLFTF